MTVIQDAQKFFKYFGNIVHCFWHIPIHRNVCFQFCAITDGLIYIMQHKPNMQKSILSVMTFGK